MSIINLKKVKVEFIAAGAAFLILCWLLLLRPIIGVADNGDFARIMNSTGLFYLSDEPMDRYFGYVNRLYGIRYAIPFGGGYLSTELPLVLLAIFINKSVVGTAVFDIRFLAVIYILILTAAIYFAVRCSRIRAGILSLLPALFFILIFCDIGYISYFNSLYGEPVSLVFLLIMAAMAVTMAVEEKPAIWMLVLFSVGAVFFTGAKVQNSPAGLLIALLCIRLAWIRKDAAWRSISIVSAVSVVLVSIACYASVSKDIKVCNRYQTVFYGILRGSQDPGGDLVDLGLDPSLAVLAGTNYFMENYPIDIRDPEFREMLYEKVSYTKVVGFYMRHPGRFLQKLEYAAENGFKLKQGFGNYEKYSGIQYKQTSNIFGFWSDFKMGVLPHTLPFVCLFFAIVFLALIYEYNKAVSLGRRFFIEFLAVIALVGIMQYVLPVIGDGDADLSKHLFLFNLSFDLLFAIGLSYLAVKGFAKSAALLRWFSGYMYKIRFFAALRMTSKEDQNDK